MIKTENYGGGIRWHCTNCDTDKSIPGSNLKHISWTNGKPPLVCPRCEPHREYRLKLELQILLPESNSARVREAIQIRKDEIAAAIRDALNGRDAKLNSWTSRPFGG